jgi:hypothetical protein
MTAPGHSRCFGRSPVISGSPPTADMCTDAGFRGCGSQAEPRRLYRQGLLTEPVGFGFFKLNFLRANQGARSIGTSTQSFESTPVEARILGCHDGLCRTLKSGHLHHHRVPSGPSQAPWRRHESSDGISQLARPCLIILDRGSRGRNRHERFAFVCAGAGIGTMQHDHAF